MVMYQFLDGYYPFEPDKLKLIERPAIVTSIDQDEPDGMHVNLHVFFEPDDTEVDPRFKQALSERGAFRYCVAPRTDDEPTKPQTWSWPPRV